MLAVFKAGSLLNGFSKDMLTETHFTQLFHIFQWSDKCSEISARFFSKHASDVMTSPHIGSHSLPPTGRELQCSVLMLYF